MWIFIPIHLYTYSEWVEISLHSLLCSDTGHLLFSSTAPIEITSLNENCRHHSQDEADSIDLKLVRLLLGRPTYMLADLYFFLSSFCRRLIYELTEQNSTKIGHTLWSKCNLKTHVPNLGYPLPLQIGGPKTTFFGRLHNLMATLTAYIFRMKHDIDNQAIALTTTRVFYIVSKQHQLWSTNGFKLDRHFYPPSINSAFYFIARLRIWRSANGTQPNFAKWWTVNRANIYCRKVGVVPPEKIGAKIGYLMGNICWTKCDKDNQA